MPFGRRASPSLAHDKQGLEAGPRHLEEADQGVFLAWMKWTCCSRAGVPPIELEGRERKECWEELRVQVVEVGCIGPVHIEAR